MTMAELEVERMIQSVRAYQEAIQPFINIKIMVMSRCAPKMVLHPDGRMEHSVPPLAQAILDQCDEQIAALSTSTKEKG